MTVRLSVPEPMAHVALKPEINPSRLQAWLMGLSNTDALGSSTPLLDALSTLNRYKLDADQRQPLMERYQTAVDIRYAPLEFLYDQHTLPLSGQAREASQRVAALLSELCYGYKHILLDRLEKRRSFGASKPLPVLMVRILKLLLQQLELCYSTYSPIPQGLWSDLHQIFLLAVQQRWLDAPEGSRETISVYYKRALLLSLADPYRLQPAAFSRARQIINDLGSLAQFESAADLSDDTGGFWIRLDEDRPPFFAVQQPGDLDARTDISLNTALLARALSRYIADLERLNPEGDEDVQGLRQLLRFWTVTPRRGFQRLLTQAQVEVRVGWPALDMQGLAEQPWPDLAGGGYLWRVVNESPGGFALHGDRLEQTPIAIGQLMGVRPLGSERWLITVVRWLQQRGSSMELGVQVLAPWGRVAMLEDGPVHYPVLLLPAIKGVRQPSTVLSARDLPLKDYTLMVSSTKRERVILSRVLERTPNLVQMVYKLASQLGDELDDSGSLPQAVGEFGE